MKTEHPIKTETMVWNGITLSVTCQRQYARTEGLTHLTIRVMYPSGARLPITETGFRSHFLNEDAVAARGGALAYARAWLDVAAESPEWKAGEAMRRQLSLF